MEKRFFIACALSLLVFMLFSSVLKKPQQSINKEVIAMSKSETLTGIDTGRLHDKEDKIFEGKVQNNLNDNDLYIIKTDSKVFTFSKKGGFLLEVLDKQLNVTVPFKGIGFTPKWDDYVFSVSELPKGVVFEYVTANGMKIKKSFRVKENDTLELTINVGDTNNSNASSYDLLVGYFNAEATKNPVARRYFESCVSQGEGIIRKPVFKIKTPIDYSGEIKWAGLRDQYSCVVVVPQQSENKGVVESLDDGSCLKLVVPERRVATASSQVDDQYLFFIGDQDIEKLKQFYPGSEKLVNFGFFDSISRAILFLLSMIYKVTKSWGLAIILVTILIYVVMCPLSLKSMLSMKKMQSLQPKIEQLRLKNKDNPQKLNIEIMELYRREKVNPLGGCLPMILQIPVFFALYQLLMRFIHLKGASFLWIKDLSEPDRLFIFKSNLPVIGNEFNLLPLLMAGGMFFQQKISAVSPDSASSEQQKMLMIVMPIVFCFLFYKLPSGLVMYWFINSLLTLGFQWKILRKNA